MSFNFMAALTVQSDFGAQENKICHCFYFSPIYLPGSDGTRCHDFSFLNVEFKPAFSLSSFTFIKRLFSSSSLTVINVVITWVSETIDISDNLNSTCDSSSQAFRVMYSTYELNKQGDNIQP